MTAYTKYEKIVLLDCYHFYMMEITNDFSNENTAYVSTELIYLTVKKDKIYVALRKAKQEDNKEIWMIPGKIILAEESIRESAEKTLKDVAGIKKFSFLGQMMTFGEKAQQGKKIIAVAHMALDRYKNFKTEKPKEIQLFDVKELPEIAFDHQKLIKDAIKLLKNRFRYSNIATYFLDEEFTLTELQELYTTIMDRNFDKRNFRKKLLSIEFLEKTGNRQRGVSNRPAELYRFKEKEYSYKTSFFLHANI